MHPKMLTVYQVHRWRLGQIAQPVDALGVDDADLMQHGQVNRALACQLPQIKFDPIAQVQQANQLQGLVGRVQGAAGVLLRQARQVGQLDPGVFLVQLPVLGGLVPRERQHRQHGQRSSQPCGHIRLDIFPT